jgi:hypothetical protein
MQGLRAAERKGGSAMAFASRCVWIAVFLLAGATTAFAETPDRPIKDFFGSYVGRSISTIEEGLSERDLAVAIKPYKDDGFTVEWTTLIRKKDADWSRKSYVINFGPTKRPGIYGSEMRSNMFGGAVPLDPLAGEPFFWSRVDGDTLSVYALIIREDGGYEMQVYDRTWTPKGLKLDFTRFRDGQPLKLITGTLERSGS